MTKMFNQEVHDNLIALGYTYLFRYKNRYDEYNHPINDDWISIDKVGRVDFPDICSYIDTPKHKAKIQRDMTPAMALRIAVNMKKIFEQKNLPYQLDIDGHKIKLGIMTQH